MIIGAYTRRILRAGVFIVMITASAALAQQGPYSVASDRAPHRLDGGRAAAGLLTDPASDRAAWPADQAIRFDGYDASALLAEDAELDRQPGVPMRIGVTRPLPVVPASPETAGQWSRTADGTRLWTLAIEAPGALAVRVHFSKFDLTDGVRVVLAGGLEESPATYDGLGPTGEGAFWARTFTGDSVYVEYQNPTGQSPQPTIEIDEILHVYRDPAAAVRPEDGGDGSGGPRGLLPCHEDVNCHAVDLTARDSVGRMYWVSGGSGWLCTGALLNDVDPNTFAGYFLTANHCLSSQTEVDTLEVRWFYQTDSCNGSVSWGPTSYGGSLLSTSPATDFTFVRTTDDPNAGQGFAAWTASPPSGTVKGIHHPGGSYKRYSEGFVTTAEPICGSLPLSNFVYNDWTIGITEGGSSGSPLFNTSWQVVGQLYGICLWEPRNCNNPDQYNNVYGRFSVTYPSVSSYLNTGTPDDAYEDNDTLGAAVELEPGSYALRLVDFDDYFKVRLCATNNISVTATFSTADMDLDLQLLTSGGGILDTSYGSSGTETVSQTTAAGDYVIRAIKDHGWGGDYTLEITLGSVADCNNNGIRDSCDIADQTSLDCNSNDVPDECDLVTAPCLIVSEIMDGTLPGGNPKYVEITNTGLGLFTFAEGGLIIQANASTDLDIDVDLTGVSIAAGDSFVVASSGNGGQAQFLAAFGFDADLYSGVGFGNGDDRYIVTTTDDSSVIMDSYGQNGVDGTGTVWEYTDSFAFRLPAFATGVGLNFDAAQWSIAPPNSLDGATPEEIGAAGTPGVHVFDPTCEDTDCNNNSVPDECDIADGTSQDCQPNAIPDDCELSGNDCNGNSVPDVCDIAGGTSPDCNANGTPDDCELSGNDCNVNGIPDECDVPAGGNCCEVGHGAGCSDPDIEACVCATDPFCCDDDWDSLCADEVISLGCGFCGEGTGPDCNGNGSPDQCDIGRGVSEDCNVNGIPDECEPDPGCNSTRESLDVNGGGRRSTSANYALTSSTGQPGGVGVISSSSYAFVGGFVPVAIAGIAVPGDIDGDGDVDFDDLDAFVAVLIGVPLDPAHVARADLNGDGTADGDDIKLFVEALTG